MDDVQDHIVGRIERGYWQLPSRVAVPLFSEGAGSSSSSGDPRSRKPSEKGAASAASARSRKRKADAEAPAPDDQVSRAPLAGTPRRAKARADALQSIQAQVNSFRCVCMCARVAGPSR